MRAIFVILLALSLVMSPFAASAGWGQDVASQAQTPANTTAAQAAAAGLTAEQQAKLNAALNNPEFVAKVKAAMQNNELMAKVQSALGLSGQQAQASGQTATAPATSVEAQLQQLQQQLAEFKAQTQARAMLRQGWMLGEDTAAALRLAGYNPDMMRNAMFVTGPNGQQVFVNGANPAVPNQPKGFWESMTTSEKFMYGFMVVAVLSLAGVAPFATWFPL